jgi:hypothetical protein
VRSLFQSLFLSAMFHEMIILETTESRAYLNAELASPFRRAFTR